MTREAVDLALRDAGCGREAVQSAFFANAGQGALEGQFMIPGQLALRSCGFSGIPIVNVENACASASTAFHLAWTQLRAGACDVALAIGAEKMLTPDRERNLSVFHGAWDVHDVENVMSSVTIRRENSFGGVCKEAISVSIIFVGHWESFEEA